MRHCNTCGNPENEHPYAHPFIPEIFGRHSEKSSDWDSRFLRLAEHVGMWSKDPSTRVGCVIVDPKRRVLSVGYNGFPRGVEDDPTILADRPAKYARVVHAELNAILNKGDVEGATLYCSLFPCNECAKSIIQSGIIRVVAPKPDTPRWNSAHAIALEMLELADVKVSYVE